MSNILKVTSIIIPRFMFVNLSVFRNFLYQIFSVLKLILFLLQIKITHIINETEMYVCKEEDIPKVSQASEIPREPLKSELKVGLVCHSNYEGDW